MSETPKPLGCDKNIDGDQLSALKNVSPSDMKALIDSHAGSEGCKNEIKNSLDTAVSRGQTMDVWLRDSATVSGSVGWSGGSASAGVSLDTGMSTTDTNLSTQASTMSGISSGCRQTLMNINESNSLYSQMTCNIKQASNIAVTDIKMGATISVQVGPTEAQVAAYDRKIAGINDNIARLMNRTEMNEFTIKSLAILNEALEKADAAFRFDIKNSSFKIDNNNIAKLTSTNNQEIENNTQIREAILKKATSEAITGVTQKFEMGAQASQDLEAYAQSKINDTSLSTTQDIVQAANETKLNVDMNGNITLNINGSLEGTNVVISQGNLTEMRSELIMKAASELGKDVAAEIIHEAITKGSLDTEGTGLASYQKAIADGLAEQAKNLKPAGGGGLFGGLFGGIIGKIAMIAIPIVIILVLFSMFGFKIALVAGLIFGIYLAIAYFVGLTPFSKENNEINWNNVEEIYDELLSRVILPRRIALFDNFIERLRTERNLSAVRWQYEYVSEIDLLISFLDFSGKTPTKLTRLGLHSSKTPGWMLATMYNLELDTYVVLINMFEDVASNNGEILDRMSIDNVRMLISILREERDKLSLLFNNIGLNPFELGLQDSAWVAALTSVNSNPPSEWQRITSDYQGWLDRGKPARRNQTAMASTSSQSTGVPMADSQQAYAMPRQGYAMADSQQAYAMPPPGYPMADIQQGYPMADSQQGYPMADIQQGYPMADSQQARAMTQQGYPMAAGISTAGRSNTLQAQPVTYAMAVPQQPPQKAYTRSGKKSHGYGKVAKKSPMYNSNQNSRGMAIMGGEISNTVQKEYSRRNPKTVKPVYHKTPDFRPK
jgi:hypothetical protein